MDSLLEFRDHLGPLKIIHLYNPTKGLQAIVVVDNVACGPAIGGVRMAPDVSTSEVVRLARAMTLKNAIAELPHGGGKSAILANPKMPLAQKEELMRAFGDAIKDLMDYTPGPDMGTNEQCMAWVKEETGRAIGRPKAMGGIPLDEVGATGFGLSVAAEVASQACHLALNSARVVIQGAGSVGLHAARFLAAHGAVLIGASDSQGTLFNRQGISVEQLAELKLRGGSVVDYPDGQVLDRDAVIDIHCDIWIPAARPDVIRTDNVSRLKTRLVLQGANIPFTEDAERICHHQNILVIPDFIANAGGVICGAVEYGGGTEAIAFQQIEDKIRRNTTLILERSMQTGQMPRQVALAIAEQRVQAAMAHQETLHVPNLALMT